MTKPTLHLICNAHLDPVWQWRWEEGAAEALSTFGRRSKSWANIPTSSSATTRPSSTAGWSGSIRRFSARSEGSSRPGRWAISGGWFLQPDVNLPGIGIASSGRSKKGGGISAEKFGAVAARRLQLRFLRPRRRACPRSCGWPATRCTSTCGRRRTSWTLPADLYRWRGADGTEIPAYRIAVGLYHTEYDNIERRLEDGVDLALKLGRDVPVFWGIGDHGGGATREDLERIDAFAGREKRVRFIHSTPDRFFVAVRRAARTAPVFEGDLERSFTGCYTSLSRLKRAAGESLGLLTQTEALRAATCWTRKQSYPKAELDRAWRGHLFNDFHDVITGSCTEPAEQDALAGYGKRPGRRPGACAWAPPLR